MGKNPCPICATPGAEFRGHQFVCGGCNLDVHLRRVVAYLKKRRTLIAFDNATRRYEFSRSVISFGEWMMQEGLELTAKP